MKTKKVKKRKFSFKKFFKFLLFLIIIISLIYLLSKEPAFDFLAKSQIIKHIKIIGNNNIRDDEIIQTANIENYPPFLTTSSINIKNKIKKLELVKDVKVKKKWGFVLEIDIEEEKVLFLLRSTNEYVLASKEKKQNLKLESRSIPVLINYVEDNELNKMIEKFSNLNDEILSKISEIEYTPTTYDPDRFLLYMSDENIVYITLSKTKELNKYNEIKKQLGTHKGILYLDSGNYFEIKE